MIRNFNRYESLWCNWKSGKPLKFLSHLRLIRIIWNEKIHRQGIISQIKAELRQSFSTCVCVFKVITLVGSNKRNYFQNANACSKRTLKTTVATSSALVFLRWNFFYRIVPFGLQSKCHSRECHIIHSNSDEKKFLWYFSFLEVLFPFTSKILSSCTWQQLFESLYLSFILFVNNHNILFCIQIE